METISPIFGRPMRPEDDEPSFFDSTAWRSVVLPDVVCYLVPRSLVTRQHVARLARNRSPHVLERPGSKTRHGHEERMSHAIALRLSSRLLNPHHGFMFGRQQGRCDVHFDAPALAARCDGVDNEHFRIFLDPVSGAPFLKDHSRTGTFVDASLLRTRDRLAALRAGNAERGRWDTKVLRDGSSIVLALGPEPGEELSFWVRFPRGRTVEQQELYESNLLAYQRRLAVPGYRRKERVVEFPAHPSPARYTKGNPIAHPQYQWSLTDPRGISVVPRQTWLWGVGRPCQHLNARIHE